MNIKEPKFMRDIHKIREKLGRKWSRMSKEEMLRSINESTKNKSIKVSTSSHK